MNQNLLLTCEHAGNIIPKDYLYLFHQNSFLNDFYEDESSNLSLEDVDIEKIESIVPSIISSDSFDNSIFNTHWAYDPGALQIAKSIAEQFKVPLFFTEISRLLIDCNRSLHNPSVFSPYTKSLSHSERQKAIDSFYPPYRRSIAQSIADSVKTNQIILHLSVHTFTPEWNGKIRNADIGLLYDPKRPFEKDFCIQWKKDLMKQNPQYRVRLNYPYPGDADGHTTALRKQFPDSHYLGIELEVNHKSYIEKHTLWDQILETITNSLKNLIINV